MVRNFFPWHIVWRRPNETVPTHYDQDRARNAVFRSIDRRGFDWRVVLVAGSTLFTNSYNLFAINFILPALQYLYSSNDGSLYLPANGLTLSGLAVGQLLFGFLADNFGRRKLYGLELLIVMISAIGIAQASDGRDHSMSLVSWVLFWRFAMGFGIGAALPLSAVITAEFAPVQSRPRMMATVFLMQPLGQLASALVSFLVAIGLNSHYSGLPDKGVDQIWRTVLGVGAVPALLSLLFCYAIPESPRYTLDVAFFHFHDIRRFTEVDRNLSDSASGMEVDLSQTNGETSGHEHMNGSQSINEVTNEIEFLPRQFSTPELNQYFLVEGNWRYLLGTSFGWFSLNFALWSLGTTNPEIVAWLWNQSSSEVASIYSRLRDYAEHDMLLVSIGAFVGSLVLIKVLNIGSRKLILIWSFVCLAVLFAITGGVILGNAGPGTSSSATVIVLYVLCHLFFNLGPNTLLYIISAEIFPTRYRATCYGISAAAGTIGSIVVEVSLFASSNAIKPSKNLLGWLLIGCSPLLIFAAILTSAWIPTLQSPRLLRDISERPQDNNVILVSKTLEQLGLGIRGAKIDGDVIGLSKNIKALLARLHVTKT